jgi:multiple sugar transport system substrate-binding protein
MTDRLRLTRRRFLGGLAAGAAAILAACGATSTPTAGTGAPTGGGAATATTGQANPFGPTATRPAPTTAAGGGAATGSPAAGGASPAATRAAAGGSPAAVTASGKLTYWGGLIFSQEANDLLSNTIKDWGRQNRVDIDVVMINQNETNTKYAAAAESNTLPDALDMGLDLLLLQSTAGKLTALDDLYDKIGREHGGWLKSINDATDPQKFGGTRAGIPFGASGNLLFIRNDVLKQAGLQPPKTWQELSDASEQVNRPPLYAMGFALSNVGDGNLQVQVLQSYGGRVADDAGKNCTITSAETRTYLEWVTSAYRKGFFPPGATTWDGAGDNTAYQSGQAVFIANPGSVYLWMKDNDKELLDSTVYSALPAGPKGRISPLGPNVRAIPKGGRNVEAARSLLEFLVDKDFMAKYYNAAIYGPVLQEQLTFEAFKDPVHSGLSDLAQNGTAPAYPDVSNAAFADFNNNFIVPKMVQRVVIDNFTLDQALDEAQRAGDAIYAKYR